MAVRLESSTWIVCGIPAVYSVLLESTRYDSLRDSRGTIRVDCGIPAGNRHSTSKGIVVASSFYYSAGNRVAFLSGSVAYVLPPWVRDSRRHIVKNASVVVRGLGRVPGTTLSSSFDWRPHFTGVRLDSGGAAALRRRLETTGRFF